METWQVINCTIVPGMEKAPNASVKKKMNKLQVGFVGCKFYFGINNQFSLEMSKDAPQYMKTLELPKDGKWKIENEASIVISNEKYGYTLMSIFVKVDNEKKYFMLDDAPFLLEVIEVKK